MERLAKSDPRRIGAYRLLARLGEGGMGLVYLAVTDDGRMVALKRIRGDLLDEEEVRERFGIEVAASQKIPFNPNTAMVIDADVTADNPWLATEYMPGPALHDVLAADQKLPLSTTLRIGRDMAAALRHIHQVGVTHRDVKPSNIVITMAGAKLIDFGIARDSDNRYTTSLTRNLAIGTPEFMSPEQAESQDLTSASDIFSLGSVLYACCTGKVPFTGTSAVHVMYSIAHAAPDLDVLPERLGAIVGCCLAKDPKERPEAVRLSEMLKELPDVAHDWPSGIGKLINARFARMNSRIADLPQDETLRRAASTTLTAMRAGTVRPGATKRQSARSPQHAEGISAASKRQLDGEKPDGSTQGGPAGPSRPRKDKKSTEDGWGVLAAIVLAVIVIAVVTNISQDGGDEASADTETSADADGDITDDYEDPYDDGVDEGYDEENEWEDPEPEGPEPEEESYSVADLADPCGVPDSGTLRQHSVDYYSDNTTATDRECTWGPLYEGDYSVILTLSTEPPFEVDSEWYTAAVSGYSDATAYIHPGGGCTVQIPADYGRVLINTDDSSCDMAESFASSVVIPTTA